MEREIYRERISHINPFFENIGQVYGDKSSMGENTHTHKHTGTHIHTHNVGDYDRCTIFFLSGQQFKFAP